MHHLNNNYLSYFSLLLDEGAALAIITKGRSDGHAEILENSVVARILEEKWKRYIKVFILLYYSAYFIRLVYRSLKFGQFQSLTSAFQRNEIAPIEVA